MKEGRMNVRRLWSLIAGPGVAVAALLLVLLLLSQSSAGAAPAEIDRPANGSLVCDNLGDQMERCLCRFVTGIYSDGLLTNWSNPRLPDHFDHTPMRDYGENQPAISESASMLALYAALIGDQTTFDYLFDVSAPAEIGGTGAPEPPSAPRTAAHLDELIAMWAVRLDVEVGRVQLREMRTKWASYSSQGTLTLHRDLLRLPRDLVDYVLCHELLHGKVPNHTLSWELLMGMHLRDWRRRERRLAAWMLREGGNG
jgi:hypothetical protein